jgi:hypothetical protein
MRRNRFNMKKFLAGNKKTSEEQKGCFGGSVKYTHVNGKWVPGKTRDGRPCKVWKEG